MLEQINQNLTIANSTYISIELSIGTPMQNSTLGYILDTGNAYLSVGTAMCTNCYPNATQGVYYNPLASTSKGNSTYSKNAVIDASVDLPRGTWAMLGQMSTDTVCLN